MPASDATEHALKAGDTLAGRYRLVRLLGEGGMGYVWEGRHLLTDKPVAIKALKGDTEADAARLLREARLSASLTHRNIVQVFDFCEPEGGGPVFLVMELLKGETLGAYLERAGRLGLEEARALGLAVAAAMRLAHAKGIVHRDLKPDNVFLARVETDDAPEIKILDFGIARPTVVDTQVTSITRTGSVIGTPHYMAPEQIYAEKDIDGRADVWALGVILYECLGGIKPFDGESFGQVFRKVTHGEVRPLAEVAPTLPRSVSDLVMSMLTVDRSTRPNSAAVHDALERLAVEAGVTATRQQTQWLPMATSSSMGVVGPPSPPRTPRMPGGVTPPALAASPSAAPPQAQSGPMPPSRSPRAAAIVGAAVATCALLAFTIVVLSLRAPERSKPHVDLGPTIGNGAAVASSADVAPAPSPARLELPPGDRSSVPTTLGEDAGAPPLRSATAPPAAAVAPAARPNAKTPKTGAGQQRSPGDPLGAGRF